MSRSAAALAVSTEQLLTRRLVGLPLDMCSSAPSVPASHHATSYEPRSKTPGASTASVAAVSVVAPGASSPSSTFVRPTHTHDVERGGDTTRPCANHAPPTVGGGASKRSRQRAATLPALCTLTVQATRAIAADAKSWATLTGACTVHRTPPHWVEPAAAARTSDTPAQAPWAPCKSMLFHTTAASVTTAGVPDPPARESDTRSRSRRQSSPAGPPLSGPGPAPSSSGTAHSLRGPVFSPAPSAQSTVVAAPGGSSAGILSPATRLAHPTPRAQTLSCCTEMAVVPRLCRSTRSSARSALAADAMTAPLHFSAGKTSTVRTMRSAIRRSSRGGSDPSASRTGEYSVDKRSLCVTMADVPLAGARSHSGTCTLAPGTTVPPASSTANARALLPIAAADSVSASSSRVVDDDTAAATRSSSAPSPTLRALISVSMEAASPPSRGLPGWAIAPSSTTSFSPCSPMAPAFVSRRFVRTHWPCNIDDGRPVSSHVSRGAGGETMNASRLRGEGPFELLPGPLRGRWKSIRPQASPCRVHSTPSTRMVPCSSGLQRSLSDVRSFGSSDTLCSGHSTFSILDSSLSDSTLLMSSPTRCPSTGSLAARTWPLRLPSPAACSTGCLSSHTSRTCVSAIGSEVTLWNWTITVTSSPATHAFVGSACFLRPATPAAVSIQVGPPAPSPLGTTSSIDVQVASSMVSAPTPSWLRQSWKCTEYLLTSISGSGRAMGAAAVPRSSSTCVPSPLRELFSTYMNSFMNDCCVCCDWWPEPSSFEKWDAASTWSPRCAACRPSVAWMWSYMKRHRLLSNCSCVVAYVRIACARRPACA